MSKNDDDLDGLVPGACCGCLLGLLCLLFLAAVAAGVFAAWKAALS